MRTFGEAIERLQELDRSDMLTAFEVGDIALEQAPIGEDGVRNASSEVLERLSDESGIPFATLEDRRKVSAHIPARVRTLAVSYSVFQLIAHRNKDERAHLLEMIQTTEPRTRSGRWTVEAVRAYLGHRPTQCPAPPDERGAVPPPYEALRDQIDVASDEAKRFAFRRLAGEPAILEEAAEIGSPVSRAVAGLERKADVLRERQREQIVQSDPVATRLEQQAAVIDIAGECNRFRVDCRRFAQTIAGLLAAAGAADEGDLFWIREALGDARAAMDQLERFMDTGRTDLDAFLETVLAGG